MAPFAIATLILIFTRAFFEHWLNHINRRHVLRNAGRVPDAFRGTVDDATYRKSVEYTLARSRFTALADACQTALLVVILFSGALPWVFTSVTAGVTHVAAFGGFLFAAAMILSAAQLPFDWYAQFRLEQRFGFNTTSMRTWMADRVKGFCVALCLLFPLLVLVLKVIEWAGPAWWLWAAGVVVTFQLLMMLLAPALILPLFNKFTPLGEGTLRERLFALANRTGFPTRSIDIMDGSRRSRHSNAFFTGFGRFRKIVLYDTLVAQLTEPELEAVLAHEIGHYKKRHVLKLMFVSIVMTLLAFGAIAWLARQDWFYRAFGFELQQSDAPAAMVPAFLLFGLLAGTFSFWLTPIINLWSRRFEYEADRFARDTMGEPGALVGALRKLSEKNLSNLTPHPLYSGFHYSHPTLLERERALTPGAG
jgi:STE24 endopeptidase